MRKLRAAVLLLGLAGLLYGGWFVWNSEPLKLRTVEVGGNEKVAKEVVASTSGLVPGSHLLRLSMKSVEDRVESISWIKDARVERILPSRVRIMVTEREPTAQISLATTSFLADEEGVVLEQGVGEFLVVSGLPIEALVPGDHVTHPQYRHGLAIAKGLPIDLRKQLVRIKAPTLDGIVLEFSDGMTVLYGAAEVMSEKNFAIQALLAEVATTGGTIASIDVRVPRRPAVTMR